MFDIAVIGGGAAGMAAAVTAAREGCSVILLEKEPRLGRKLAATGNGRCNFTNIMTDINRYHGADASFAVPALERFSPAGNIAFFRSLGIMAKEEDKGKVFPLSLQAAAVLDMFRQELEHRKVCLRTDTRIDGLYSRDKGFRLESQNGEKFSAAKVIVACGGMASPELGGCHFGYDLLETQGHRISELAPALVKIKTDNRLPNALKGIKVEGVLMLKKRRQKVSSAEGEILFTDYGLSGPPVLELSRFLCFEDAEDFTVEMDLLSEFDENELNALLRERRTILAEAPLECFLTGVVQKKVGMLLLKEALHTKLSRLGGSLSDEELLRVAHILKHFALPVKGVLGWKQSQVTAGGILTGDFDGHTMESKLVPGLYAAGEVLDIDGDCGGFNLQWAWASGRLAAESAVSRLKEER